MESYTLEIIGLDDKLSFYSYSDKGEIPEYAKEAIRSVPFSFMKLWKEAKEKKIYQGVNGRSIRSFKGIYMVEIINNKVTDFKII